MNLQLAELEEMFPVAVYFFLDLLDHPLVAGLEHVGKTALHLQILLNGQLVFGLVVEDILALDDLKQRPYAGLNSGLGDLQQLLAGIAPAAGAGGPSRSGTPGRGCRWPCGLSRRCP